MGVGGWGGATLPLFTAVAIGVTSSFLFANNDAALMKINIHEYFYQISFELKKKKEEERTKERKLVNVPWAWKRNYKGLNLKIDKYKIN